MIIRGYKYKLNPTEKQKRILNRAFGCSRFVYNWGLRRKIKYHKENGGTLCHKELMKELTELKKQDKYKWLYETSSTVSQKALMELEQAFSKFFKEKRKFPRFRNRKYSKRSAKYDMRVSFDFNSWKVKIPMCGTVKVYKSRQFDSSHKTGTLTVSQDKCGNYWCSINVYYENPIPKVRIEESSTIGIDLGIKTYITLSNGTKYHNPKFFEENLKKNSTFTKKTK